MLVWSLALSAKAQPLPFWTVSLGAGIVFCAFRRRWRDAVMMGLVLVSSLALMQFWQTALGFFLRGRTVAADPVPGLVNVTAFVPSWSVRVDALVVLLFVGLPFVLGIVYAAWRWLKHPNTENFDRRALELLLLTFVWSWAVWFLGLSIGWARYLFPAFFVGSMFIGFLLDRSWLTISLLRIRRIAWRFRTTTRS